MWGPNEHQHCKSYAMLVEIWPPIPSWMLDELRDCAVSDPNRLIEMAARRDT